MLSDLVFFQQKKSTLLGCRVVWCTLWFVPFFQQQKKHSSNRTVFYTKTTKSSNDLLEIG